MKKTDVACAIIRKDERILVTQRGSQSHRPGKWEFPGGKLEKDETADQCIIREIREELDINIRVIRWLPSTEHNYPDIRIRLIPCIAEIISGTVKAKEHSDIRWVNKNELMSFDWSPADIPVVEKILETDF